ncbi:MAG: hypothetical protein ACN2B6_12450 [Rickettsiales bacterium]
MAKVNPVKIVEVNLLINGEPAWVKAFVTWEDERSMRVTPVDGDPLHSIHIDKKRGIGDLYRDA